MRVAHFIQRYPPALGGSEAYFARLSRFLATHGDAVTVFTSNALELEAFWRLRAATLAAGTTILDGVEVRRYGLCRFPGRRYVLKALGVLPQRTWQCLTMPCNPIAWRMLTDAGRHEPRFDVVHAAAFPYAWPIVCGLRLARTQGIPFFLTPFLHLGDPDDANDATRRAYTTPALLSLVRAAQRVFVQTESERTALLERGIAAEKLVLQGMGVEPAECTGGDRRRARSSWLIEADEVVVGHLANLSVEKGTVDLLRAAEVAWKRGHRFRLLLAGPQMPNFGRLWEPFESRQNVVCLGRLSDEQKRDFFAAIDVFALPSRSDSFGLVLLEAWANGVPNVGYRAGGIADVIQHDEDGLLVRCGDVARLADALGRYVRDAELRYRLGRSGRERTEHEFRWPDKLDLVRCAYAEAIRTGS
jgi:glycosyltransferase involved in cell wall biosynthesis